MLRWALAFAIIAVVAGLFGFYGVEGVAADIAKFFALVFVVLFVIALIVGRRVIDGPTTTYQGPALILREPAPGLFISMAQTEQAISMSATMPRIARRRCPRST
jgi:uncharacterized membrane protein YtjA (UPF0391 family)